MIQRSLFQILKQKNVFSRYINKCSNKVTFTTIKFESKTTNGNIRSQNIIYDPNLNNTYIHDISKINQSECWNCNSRSFQSNLFICGSCQHLQDPTESITSMNYFKLFELNLHYNVDQQELTQRFKDLQKNFHPDKFHSFRDPKIIKFSETYSTYINQAYSTLKDDLKRGEYLIDLLTHGQKEDLEKKIDQNPQFLNEIMMERMEIEECETDQQLQIIYDKLKDTQNQINKSIDQCLQNEDYDKATEILIRMRYNQSSINAIKSKSEQIILLK